MDVFLKLIIAFIIQKVICDRLLLYGILTFCVQILDFLIYRLYAKRMFKEIKYKWIWNKSLIKEMMGFAGWSLLGNLAGTCYTQGLNLLLNFFFGPAVNAARGIAVQVQGLINQFAVNFQTALNPQIIKSYAEKDFYRMHQLIFASSKYGFLLLLFIAMPVIFEAHFILKLWLGIVPEYTVTFFRIIVFISMIDATANALITSAQATGKIKIYQLVVGGILLLILPASYIVLKMGGEPESVFIVNLSFAVLAQIARLWLLRHMINISIRRYISNVVIRILCVGLLSSILPFMICNNLNESFTRVILVSVSSICSTLIFVFAIGLNRQEKEFIKDKIQYIKRKLI